ncbi:hypothetical protein [Streptomyces chattanoogensis]|uniref:hypothetical protein n=1 Tax=Streptomyces chattanoogensis TaxID=66876 RepID=UPI000ADC81E3|nr:hypothetical protein [Streptomyces chattanoogensis]
MRPAGGIPAGGYGQVGIEVGIEAGIEAEIGVEFGVEPEFEPEFEISVLDQLDVES